jgi:hypothetical protein
MKLSKITLVGTLLIVFLSNFIKPSIKLDNSLIEVYFSNKQDIGNLAKIKSDLLEKSIKLNYDYLKFTPNGKLSAIEYQVTTDKFGGSDKTDDTNKEIGFIISTDPKSKFGIIVGTKESIQKRKIALENQK